MPERCGSSVQRGVLAILALMTTAGLAACSPPDDRPKDPAARTSGSPSAAEVTPSPGRGPQTSCADSPLEGCHEIRVEGRAYRYYLSPPKRATGTALLVDLGGPGISLSAVLGQDWVARLREDLGVLADGKALLLLDEPWTTGTQDARCRTSSANFYAAVRRNWRSARPASFPRISCPWGKGQYGWSPSSYRRAVTAILAEHRFGVLDLAGLSFGAVRYAYIDDLVRSAVLVRPAAAPGTSSAAVLDARVAEIWRALVTQCPTCSSSNVSDRVRRLLDRYAGTSVNLPSRSVPLTDFDVASALVAVAISGRTGPSLRWHASSVDLEAAGRLSDALWLRVGVGDVSPALTAYIDEYCQAYHGPVQRGGFDAVRYILSAPTLCTGIEPPPDRSPPRAVACLVVGKDDPSAPAALARTWSLRAAGARVTSRDDRHWFSDVHRCGTGATS